MLAAMRNETVQLTECGVRDGLQSLGFVLPTEDKVALVEQLIAAGVRSFDVASFVDPKRVPTMADAEELCARLPRVAGVTYAGFVPNMRALERARAARIDVAGLVVAATDSFNRNNANCTTDEALARASEIAAAADMPCIGVVSCCTHCPYEGRVAPEAVRGLANALLDAGCTAIALGETTGLATPEDMRLLLDLVLADVPVGRFGLHLHDTYGQGIANCAVGLDYGVRRFDASFAGIGGCPFAPGAAGNVASEDLIWMLQGAGFETGIDLAALAKVGMEFCDTHDVRHAAKAGRAVLAG
jgi:hydroxymethylglutaryl-CoA lyase